jgi:hypothetical protein
MEQCPRAVLFLLLDMKFSGDRLENILIKIKPVKRRILRQPIYECHAADAQNTVRIAFFETIIVRGRAGAISPAPIQIKFGAISK